MALINWWVSLSAQAKRIGWIAGAITALIVLATTAANTLQMGERHFLATRGFVRDNVTETRSEIKTQLIALNRRLIESQLSLARDEKKRITERIASYQFMLSQNVTAPAEMRDNIRRQIEDLTSERADVAARIETLEAELSGRRP